ncbi:MAG: AMP-binding protein [Bacteroidales bacterium]|nr:AMP-binding protein [Bacteroidales bacterium]MDY6348635.1 AMP-binding protein [Bacteroidales bacterium]
MTRHLLTYYNEIFPKYWEEPAFTDYNGTDSYTFRDVAEEVSRLHKFFFDMGVRQGDKIALCGRNCAKWAVSYLAIASYGAVVVTILHDFSGEDIEGLINHSDSKLLIVGPYVWKNMHAENMPGLEAIVSLTDFSMIATRHEDIKVSRDAVQVPCNNHIFTVRDIDDLFIINYTSGSTGSPKGVMLTYRNVSANVASGLEFLPPGKERQNVVSMLPLAHMYGQLAEFLYPLAAGCHIYFLTKSPTPTLLMKAFADVHPYIIVTVPLVIEKICKRAVLPVLEKKSVKRLMKFPVVRKLAVKTIRGKLMKAFGGKLKYFIVGGAAINPEVEDLLLNIDFPLIVGYGMTECAPLIGGCYVDEFVRRSGGHILPGNEIRIDSGDPYSEVGEILVRGEHVMKGYYKNEEATKAVFTDDGWMRTGDLGIIDEKSNIFIKGRSKTMILSSTGQNIYPEEIEGKLNDMEGVSESVVVERGGKLVALVFPDYEGELRFKQTIPELMKENLQKLNEKLPKYAQIFNIEIRKQEFEKTPKRSIKRFLYK